MGICTFTPVLLRSLIPTRVKLSTVAPPVRRRSCFGGFSPTGHVRYCARVCTKMALPTEWNQECCDMVYLGKCPSPGGGSVCLGGGCWEVLKSEKWMKFTTWGSCNQSAPPQWTGPMREPQQQGVPSFVLNEVGSRFSCLHLLTSLRLHQALCMGQRFGASPRPSSCFSRGYTEESYTYNSRSSTSIQHSHSQFTGRLTNQAGPCGQGIHS